MSLNLILTHPGGSHKDELLACSLLAAVHRVPIVRREPTAEDLADLLDYLRELRTRLDSIAQQAQIWTVDDHEILFLPRTDPLPDEPSAGIDRYLASSGNRPRKKKGSGEDS